MSMHYDLGEKKVRPNVYERHTNAGGTKIAGARNGYAAIVVKADWGAENAVTELTNPNDIFRFYGYPTAENTVGLIQELFDGGASTVYVSRLGTGATKSKIKLEEANGTEVATMAMELTAKYGGARKFSVVIKSSLDDSYVKECIIYEGSKQVEKIVFNSPKTIEDSLTEVDYLIAAGANSDFFTFKKVDGYTGTGMLKTGTYETATEGANAGDVSNEDYSKALTALEPYMINAVCVDTDDEGVQMLLVKWCDRMFNEGRKSFAVIGLKASTQNTFDARLKTAKAMNDKCTICVGNGFKIGNVAYEGTKAAARLCGMVASVPAESTLTRSIVQGATDLTEVFTNAQYNKCIENGLLVFSKSQDGLIWVDKAITTFTVPNEFDDLGWSKIKRAKIRFELFTRVSQTVDTLVARVRNNNDGRATVQKAINNVLKAMAAEEKIEPDYACYLDPDNPPQGDEAWWIIEANDIDALEIVYLHYKFRFSPEV